MLEHLDFGLNSHKFCFDCEELLALCPLVFVTRCVRASATQSVLSFDNTRTRFAALRAGRFKFLKSIRGYGLRSYFLYHGGHSGFVQRDRMGSARTCKPFRSFASRDLVGDGLVG